MTELEKLCSRYNALCMELQRIGQTDSRAYKKKLKEAQKVSYKINKIRDTHYNGG